jgi:4-hydroxybenzoate polyprenyltransferase
MSVRHAAAMMPAAPDTTMPARPKAAWSLVRLLSCIRISEVLVLQGAPLLGAVFSMGHLTAGKAVALALVAAGSTSLVAHVFVLNDWSGMHADLRDPNRTGAAFTNTGIGRGSIAWLWMALLALSLLLLSPLGSQTLIIALAIAGLSALYSAPGVLIKGVPVLNSALHLVGGVLHFLLGYSVFSPVDARGLAIGGFFALVFVAGHLTHEARDSDGDLLNGISTNAVRFGKVKSFAAGLVLFTVADVLLVVLAVRGAVPRPLVLMAALYPLHLYWSFETLRAGLTFESIRRLQMRYRLIYAAVGAIMLVSVLLGR